MAVDTPEEGSPAAQSTRMLRMRRSQVISYNENVISGTAHRRSSVAAGNRTISGETLIDNEPAQNLLQDGIDALNMDWNIKSSKSDSKTGEGILNAKLPRRKSTRLEKLVKATDEIVSKVSVLGKRGRDAVDAGKAAAVDVAKSVQRRASLRPRLDPEEDIQEETPRKKAKLSKPEVHFEEPVKSTKLKISQPRPRVKHWLKQGLYVGQHRNFKSRLTEQENKLLAAELPPERKILPLPMFAGERLLEDGRDFKLPYDIFSPLPPGQPKPEEWKKKQRSELLHCVFDVDLIHELMFPPRRVHWRCRESVETYPAEGILQVHLHTRIGLRGRVPEPVHVLRMRRQQLQHRCEGLHEP